MTVLAALSASAIMRADAAGVSLLLVGQPYSRCTDAGIFNNEVNND